MAAHMRCWRSVCPTSKYCRTTPCNVPLHEDSFVSRIYDSMMLDRPRSLTKITTTHLNVQYRMVSESLELTVILYLLKGRMRSTPTNRTKFNYPECEVTEFSTILSGCVEDMRVEHIGEHAVWIEPCVSELNATSKIVPPQCDKFTMNETRRFPCRRLFYRLLREFY